MAVETSTTTVLTDDLDGTRGETVKTRRFVFDREMELSDANYVELSAKLGELLKKSRETKPAKKATTGRTRARSNDSAERQYNRKVKDWARDNGHNVPDRGRPTRNIIAAYVAATGDVR